MNAPFRAYKRLPVPEHKLEPPSLIETYERYNNAYWDGILPTPNLYWFSKDKYPKTMGYALDKCSGSWYDKYISSKERFTLGMSDEMMQPVWMSYFDSIFLHEMVHIHLFNTIGNHTHDLTFELECRRVERLHGKSIAYVDASKAIDLKREPTRTVIIKAFDDDVELAASSTLMAHLYVYKIENLFVPRLITGECDSLVIVEIDQKLLDPKLPVMTKPEDILRFVETDYDVAESYIKHGKVLRSYHRS